MSPVSREDFLTALFGETMSLIELRAIAPGRKPGEPVPKSFTPARGQASAATRESFIGRHPGDNLFFGCATRANGSSGKLENCLETLCVWCDIDFKDLPEEEARRLVLAFPVPPSIWVHSGGGWHLYWLLDERVAVNDPQLRQVLEGLVRALHGDHAAAEPARCMRVPGTQNMKYTPSRDVVVTTFEPARRTTLAELLSHLPVPVVVPQKTETAGLTLAPLQPMVDGCDFIRHCRDHQAQISEPQWYALLSNLSRCAGGRAAAHAFSKEYPGYTAAETDAKFDHARAGSAPITCAHIQALGFTGCPAGGHGVASPAALGLRPHDVSAPAITPAAAPPGGRVAIIVAATSVKPEAITWLDPGRLAVGALTMAVGLPDQGKTLIACDLTARLSTGMPLPPGPRTPDVGARRHVVILTNEDTLATTMVPRLIEAKADLTQISFIQMVRDADGAVSLLTLADDLDALEAAIETERPALVVIDGLVGYLGDVKSHNDADVRRVLSPFAAVLGRTNTAGLGLMHPPKVTTNLHYYAGGSVAFTAVPRVVLGVAPDPEDEHENPRRFLAKLKGNLYGHVPTLAYRITAVTAAAVPHLEWEPEPVTVNLTDLFAPPKETPEDRSTRRECEAWLRRTLADGPKPALEMEAAAEDAGFKRHTLRRAKERVCDSVKDGSRWMWFLLPADQARA